MLPLDEALVEVHKEYERASRVARDIAYLYKKATTTSELLNEKCQTMQAKTKNCRRNVARLKRN